MTASPSQEDRDERIDSIPPGVFRRPSRRDRDRVRFSRQFRRLKGVTQVARAGESYLYHDRLTHSMKVAQIAKSLVKIFYRRHEVDPEVAIGYSKPTGGKLAASLDPHVVEAAANAHDIGHPPFGHTGEDELDSILTEETEDRDRTRGFEGNAQSFRVVTQLEAHREEKRGLNLTRATLNAMLKYPWSREENDDKWGYYPSETDAFEFARDPLPESRDQAKTLEAQIMDYADDLTYAIHDLEDFYRTGLIPLDRLFRESIGVVEFEMESGDDLSKYTKYGTQSREELNDFEEYLRNEGSVDPDDFSIPGFLCGLALEFDGSTAELLTPFGGTDAERQALNEFTSQLIAKYLEAKRESNAKYVKLSQANDGLYNLRNESYEREIQVLKELTKYYVIANPTLMQQQRGQRRIIRELFEDLNEEAAKDRFPKSAIPSPFRERLKNVEEAAAPRERIIVDMISAMTERQAIALHKRLCGTTPGALHNEILR